ncbi:gephyrin-like molybdotransferase Glp [Paenibacillus sp. 1P07SE]|uniref:molybdopterin molybdotransferase MoeA n=1 Tax=Paenibacillus sp. 1P07SE TaxID=3132209 RepID=UPI0039A6FFE0
MLDVGEEELSRFNRRAVPVGEAQQLLLSRLSGVETSRPVEHAALWESGGRRLAQALTATSDWPPFPRAGLDGFAIRSADVLEASAREPVTLRVIDAIAAGEVSRAIVEPGTAVRLMTGAAVPEGADAVVMLEQTAHALLAGAAAVQVKHAAAPGQHMAQPGEEFRLGGALAGPGTLITPGHIAVFGTFGYAEVAVFAKPRIAVFATGGELLPVGAQLEPGRIRDSNSAMLAALVARSGGEPVLFGALPDRLDQIVAAIDVALTSCDGVMTTGGVSVGDYDVMAELMSSIAETGEYSRMPSQVLFTKVAMRPGSPTSAAMIGDKPLLALSGNPGACFVGFELFGRPLIRQLLGDDMPLPASLQAELGHGIDKGSPHERFVRCRLRVSDGRLQADPLGYGKSGMMASLPASEGLIRVPSGSRGAAAGDQVEVLLLRDAPMEQ